MTFKETELQELMTKLLELAKKVILDPNLVSKLNEMLDMVPIYPGIFMNSVTELVNEKKISELSKGDFVSITTENGTFQGEVSSTDENSVVLKNVTVLKNNDEIKIEKKDIKKIHSIDLKVLEKRWKSILKK